MKTPKTPRKTTSSKPAAARLRLVAYARVSSDEQARDGYGLAAQRAAVARWAEAQGHHLVALHEDGGVSGAKAPHKRAGFQQALALLHAGEADGIVALEQSRFSRDLRAWLALRDFMDRKGWTLALVDSGALTQRSRATAAENLNEGVRALMAQHYRDFIAEKTREALARIREEGRNPTRRVRFGFRTETSDAGIMEAGDRSQLLPHPDEQPILEQIKALAKKGWGVRRIAKALPLNPRTEQPFRPRTVESILATERRWAAGW